MLPPLGLMHAFCLAEKQKHATKPEHRHTWFLPVTLYRPYWEKRATLPSKAESAAASQAYFQLRVARASGESTSQHGERKLPMAYLWGVSNTRKAAKDRLEDWGRKAERGTRL